MDVTKVAIIGLGTVGAGVARLLLEQQDRVASRAGRRLELVQAVVRDPRKPRESWLPAALVGTDIERVTNDPAIRVVAHLVGGVEPARTILLRLLEAGKDVVTANKAVLAEHGEDLFARARQLGRSIAFDAAVAGGIPIVTNLVQCLAANQITSLRAILNGTSNFVISEMEEHGADYHATLQQAQALGYAEADPTMDIDGTDSAQKLAILARLAYGVNVPWRTITRSGIDRLHTVDIRCARELGYRIKLMAVAQLADGGTPREGLELHVSPTLVRAGTQLADTRGAFNAIHLVGDAVGEIFFHGQGAGQMPTASAVVADMMDMAVGRAQLNLRSVIPWGTPTPRVVVRDCAALRGRYYLRLMVDDHPGVLAEIAGILGCNNISIASVLQHELDGMPTDGCQVPLVIMTHKTVEGAVQRAVEEIDGLSAVGARTIRMRVLDD